MCKVVVSGGGNWPVATPSKGCKCGDGHQFSSLNVDGRSVTRWGCKKRSYNRVLTALELQCCKIVSKVEVKGGGRKHITVLNSEVRLAVNRSGRTFGDNERKPARRRYSENRCRSK